MRFTPTKLRFGNVNLYAAKPDTCMKKNFFDYLREAMTEEEFREFWMGLA